MVQFQWRIAAGFLALSSVLSASDKFTVTDGVIRVKVPKIPKEHLNEWPKEQEDAYWKRATPLIKEYKGKANKRSTGEHEKWGLPANFLAYLAGDTAEALEGMQAEDLEAKKDHAHTQGIDLYWCFTLKGQMRKFFGFGDALAPAYMERFRKGAKEWTKSDPRPGFETILLFDSPDKDLHAYAAQEMEKMTGEKFGQDREKWRAFWKKYSDEGWKSFEDYERLKNTRPHPKYGIGKGPVGGAWHPEIRGFVVDARNTDNLRAMREIAVYLMAEETGNELTRKIFKEKIRRTALGFYGMGMGEWDSEGYHGHSFSAWVNLYDYAKDPEVRGYAKAILDYLSAACAVKYFHGCWGGPVKRDYGNVKPFSTAAATFYPYVGSAPHGHADLELAWVFMSAYRPPMAIVKMAEKKVSEPYELLNSHPNYENWLPGADEKPAFHETMFYGKSFQLGTIVEGASYDVNGFKLVFKNDKGTGDYFVALTSKKPKFKNPATTTAGGDRIAQYRNLVLLVNRSADAYLPAFLTKGVATEKEGDFLFIKGKETWVALQPLNGKWEESKGILAKGSGKDLTGWAVEVGEKATHGDFGAFKKGVLSKTKVDLKEASSGVVSLTGSKGNSIKMALEEKGLPKVWRNGEAHDWANHQAVYSPAKGGKSPIHLGWKDYKMTVESGGWIFEGELKQDGTYISSSRKK